MTFQWVCRCSPCCGAVSKEVFDIADLVDGEVEFAGESLDLGFGAAVDVEVEFAAEAVLGVLTVLAHHDDRCLESGEHGEEEVEQDEGIRIPGVRMSEDVDAGVDDERYEKGDDELPGTPEACDTIGDAVAKGSFFFDDLVRIALGSKLNEALGSMELAT